MGRFLECGTVRYGLGAVSSVMHKHLPTRMRTSRGHYSDGVPWLAWPVASQLKLRLILCRDAIGHMVDVLNSTTLTSKSAPRNKVAAHELSLSLARFSRAGPQWVRDDSSVGITRLTVNF